MGGGGGGGGKEGRGDAYRASHIYHRSIYTQGGRMEGLHLGWREGAAFRIEGVLHRSRASHIYHTSIYTQGDI